MRVAEGDGGDQEHGETADAHVRGEVKDRDLQGRGRGRGRGNGEPCALGEAGKHACGQHQHLFSFFFFTCKQLTVFRITSHARAH